MPPVQQNGRGTFYERVTHARVHPNARHASRSAIHRKTKHGRGKGRPRVSTRR